MGARQQRGKLNDLYIAGVKPDLTLWNHLAHEQTEKNQQLKYAVTKTIPKYAFKDEHNNFIRCIAKPDPEDSTDTQDLWQVSINRFLDEKHTVAEETIAMAPCNLLVPRRFQTDLVTHESKEISVGLSSEVDVFDFARISVSGRRELMLKIAAIGSTAVVGGGIIAVWWFRRQNQ